MFDVIDHVYTCTVTRLFWGVPYILETWENVTRYDGNL